MNDKKKNNPWMIATVFLIGLITGFGTGKITTYSQTNILAQEQITKQSQNPTLGDTTKAETLDNSVKPSAVDTIKISYQDIEKNKNNSGQWTLGSNKAKVVIEEFSDFQCPYCKGYFDETFPLLLKNYISTGKVYYIYHNYPLSFHPQAPKAGEAALCAGDQDKYWEMHDLLFKNQNLWSFKETHLKTYQDLADALGLTKSTFEQCLNSGKYTAQVEKETSAGKEKLISGTPTFFINGEKLVGAHPYEDFQTLIEAALQK